MGMATHNVPLPDDLWGKIQSEAESEHRPVEDLLAEAVTQYLDDRSWTKILGYGQRRARNWA